VSIIETEALVLRNYNISEADKLVLFLTRKHGIVRGVARGAKRLKSRFGSCLEPFSQILLTYKQKEHHELVSVRQTELYKSNFELVSEPEKLLTYYYLSELLQEFAPPNEPNELLFRMSVACLSSVNEKLEKVETIVSYFEVWLLKISGYLPNFKHCGKCQKNLLIEETSFLDTDLKHLCQNCLKTRSFLQVTGEQRIRLMLIQKKSPVDFRQIIAEQGFDYSEISKLSRIIIKQILGRDFGYWNREISV